MAGEGERKRKAGLDIDYDSLLGRDDEPPPELMITDAAGKPMSPEDAEERDEYSDSNIKKLSDKELIDKSRVWRMFLRSNKLVGGGEKLRIRLEKVEAEIKRRERLKASIYCAISKVGEKRRVCGLQNTDMLPSSHAYKVQPRDHSSSSHEHASHTDRKGFEHAPHTCNASFEHTTYVPGHVYHGPEDPIFSFAWSQRQTLIDDIAKKTHDILLKDKGFLEQIGEYATSRAVKEIMEKLPEFEEHVRGQARSRKENEQTRVSRTCKEIL